MVIEKYKNHTALADCTGYAFWVRYAVKPDDQKMYMNLGFLRMG
jgi:hypothetical protein